MPDFEFKLGTTHGNLTNIESMSPAIMIPDHTFKPYSRDIDLGDASVRGGGWASATWTWGVITQAERNHLKSTYCSGKSADVYVNTIQADGTYQEYTAILVWPAGAEEMQLDLIRDLEIVFQNMEEYTP